MDAAEGSRVSEATSLLGRISTALANHEAVFALGGAVDIDATKASAGKTSSPLAVRWDSGGGNHAQDHLPRRRG